MSTIGDKYLLGAGRSDHDRLRVISEIHDRRTRELLRKAGLVAGHRFVEFGCGLGYVTRWAAGEGAQATGIDLNEDHLTVATQLAQVQLRPKWQLHRSLRHTHSLLPCGRSVGADVRKRI
jgi:2-polyprenyl-3-methyl-5-hydroxy-6-metoxy-1,4-benzoquinol methylase